MELTKVANDELERDENLENYGHRGPDEFELSVHRTVDDPSWLEQQLTMFAGSGIDVHEQLAEQQSRFESAWERLQAACPKQAKKSRGALWRLCRAPIDGKLPVLSMFAIVGLFSLSSPSRRTGRYE